MTLNDKRARITEQLNRMMERVMERAEERGDNFFFRAYKLYEAGGDLGDAWLLQVARELAKEPWPQELLEVAAFVLLRDRTRGKLGASFERKLLRPVRDSAMIDWLTDKLKAEGVSNPRDEAVKMYAGSQNVTIHALRKRRQRSRED